MARVSLKDVYAAPRRFDMASILVVSLAFSVMFALLRFFLIWAQTFPEGEQLKPVALYASVSGFFVLVATGQAFLFKGKRPRLASVLIGILVLVLCTLIPIVMIMGSYRFFHSLLLAGFWELAMPVISLLLFGTMFGYVAGGLIGATFLIADVVRQWLSRTDEQET